MIYVLVYYLIDACNKIELEPRIYQCKNFNDAVVKQNHLHEIGFTCQFYSIKEGEENEA